MIPDLDPYLLPHIEELIRIRRDIHAHPEIGYQEHRTTAVVADRLREAGLKPVMLPITGLFADIEPDGWEHTIALRADLDALALPDETTSSFRSCNPGFAHACGHDVHTTIVLGAGLVLSALAQDGFLDARVRLIFQPAEEKNPGGSLSVMDNGGLDAVDRIVALHCDPHLDTGLVGTRVGAITSASDLISIEVLGSGGHTSRPHLTQDVVHILGELITQVPAILNRRFDPRSAVSLVWGRVSAGNAPNAIPATGSLEGTLRCLDLDAWHGAAAMIELAVRSIVAPYGADATFTQQTGVPPTINDETVVALQDAAVYASLGPLSLITTPQSMGGEDFAWYLEKVPGALARLGTRHPGGPTHDLHRGDFDPDERAIEAGIRFMVATALLSSQI